MGLFIVTDHNHASADERLEPSVSVELATPSLKHEWLDNGAIFRTTLFDSSRQTIDHYANRWMEVAGSLPATKPAMFILDISKVSFTIYGRTRSLEIMHFRKEIKVYTAIIEKNNVEARFSQMFIRTLDRETSNVRLRMFYTMDDALRWLNDLTRIGKAVG